MKKKLLSLGIACAIAFSCGNVNALTLDDVKGNPKTAQDIVLSNATQEYINEIGFKILNANKINKHINFETQSANGSPTAALSTAASAAASATGFGYFLPTTSLWNFWGVKDDVTFSKRTLFKNRSVGVTSLLLANATNDDEVAALISHEIAHCLKSYTGVLRGSFHGIVYLFTAKKQNYDADKVAVELMVNAGYNPNALITILTKTAGQYRFDIGENALTTKRIREINDYIKTNYPNTITAYSNNPIYQNAMLIIQPSEKNQNWKYYTQKIKKIKK